MPSALRHPTLCLALLLPACDPAAADDEPVARDTLAALDANAAQLRLHDGLFGPVDLAGVSLALAPKKVIQQVRGGLTDNLADPACHTLDTDDATYLELIFDRCRYNGAFVDGTLRIALTPEAGTCDDVPCVVATRYTTTLTDFTAGKSHVRAATSQLRVPEVRGEPRTYTADVTLTDARGRELHLQHELTWTRAKGCATAELGAELDVDDRTISIGAQDVEVCGNDCPRAGDVQLSWDDGDALTWTFTGATDVVVHGPHGRSFTLTQSCDEAP